MIEVSKSHGAMQHGQAVSEEGAHEYAGACAVQGSAAGGDVFLSSGNR